MKKLINVYLFLILGSIPIILNAQCIIGGDEPPGCDFRCEKYFGKLDFLNPDITPVNSACPDDFNTRWISVTAKEDFIKITLDSFTCSLLRDFSVQVFNQNLESISSCKSFDTRSSGDFLLVSNLTIGERYSIAFQSSFDTYCPFEMTLEGIETDFIADVSDIRLVQNGFSTTAEIDLVPGALGYKWTISDNGQITTGQGTTQIEIDWATRNMSFVCVEVDFECVVKEKCTRLYSGFNNQACLPSIGGTPAGNELSTACMLCGPIYQGSTAGYTPTAPGSAGFPCGDIENNQFISFVANIWRAGGETTITILPSNCRDAKGVEMVIYDQNFNAVSTCFSLPDSLVPGRVIASGLVQGDVYWMMIDGFEGDECDFLVSIDGCYHCGPPDPPPPMIVEPDTSPICPGAIVKYSNHSKDFADYEWIIPPNGNIIDGGGSRDTFVVIQYFGPGGGLVRFTPSNFCFPGIPAIEPVVVLPVLPTLKPPEFICVEDLPIVRDGNIFTEVGAHEVTYLTDLGCDSVVTYVFIPLVQSGMFIDTTLCPGEDVFLGGNVYNETGVYLIPIGLPTSNDCDSLITLDLKISPFVEIALPDLLDFPTVPRVKLDGSASSNEPGITYEWKASNGGVLDGATDEPIAYAISAGTYTLTVKQSNSTNPFCFENASVDVAQRLPPPPIFSSSVNRDSSSIFRTSSVYVICPGDKKQLSVRPSRGADFSWTPSTGLSCVDCPKPIASPSESTTYILTATLPDGRVGSTDILVSVLPNALCNRIVSVDDLRQNIPNAFFEKGIIDEAFLIEVQEELNDNLIEKTVEILPNPTSGLVEISSSTSIEKIAVFDLSGKKILEATDKKIDLSNFPKGVYIFKMEIEGRVVVKRVVLI